MKSLLRIAGLALAHFVISMVVAVLAFGLDLDQLRSRSVVSRIAGYVNDVLQYPHDTILRSLPPGAILRPAVIPAVLLASSILWGIALYAIWRAARVARREACHGTTPGSHA